LGELDVVVLDLSSGTGNVQLMLCQDVELSGAMVDARKGVEMFRKLGMLTLVGVGNMS